MISVRNFRKKHRISLNDVTRTAGTALKAVGCSGKRLSVTLVSDHRIRTLNRKYHGQDRPTDCLAFGYGKSPVKTVDSRLIREQLWGEVVISLDRARVYARRWDEPFNREVLRYVVHGVLHLAGYRDHTPRTRRRMHLKQEAVLRRAIKVIKGKKGKSR